MSADRLRSRGDRELAAKLLLGEGAFGASLDVEAVRASLEERIAEANERVPHARRIQVLRDLCVVACANGRVTEKERKVIDTFSGLGPSIAKPAKSS